RSSTPRCAAASSCTASTICRTCGRRTSSACGAAIPTCSPVCRRRRMAESPSTAAAPARAWVATRLAAPIDALEIQSVDIPVPGPGEVRIAVKAFCLDFNDIDTIYGRYFLLPFQPPFVPGMAAAGVVDAVGPGAETLLGKRVVGTTVGAKGSYASAALLGSSSVQLVPSWLSFT